MATLKLIDSLDAFLPLATAWDELLRHTPLDHVYMRHGWFEGQLRSRTISPQVAIPTLWRDGQLVAAAPLQIVPQKLKIITARALKFIQTPISPRCNFIALEQTDAAELARSIRSIPGWDLLIAENLDAELPISGWVHKGLVELDASGVRVEEGRHSPFLSTSGTWEAYLQSVGGKRRNFINSECINRLKKAKSFRFERLTSSADTERALQLMLAISEKSWKGEAGSSIGKVDSMRQFYDFLTRRGLAQGWVDIRVLHIDDAPVAFDYFLTAHDTYIGVRTDYDPTARYYHPGENIRISVIQDLFALGRPALFDMSGDPDPYKLKWASGIKKHQKFTLGNRTPLGQAIMLGKYTVWPRVKNFLQKKSAVTKPE